MKSTLTLLTTLLFLTMTVWNVRADDIIYMSPDGTGSGYNGWSDATSDITSALPSLSGGKLTVYMKAGIYDTPVRIHYSDINPNAPLTNVEIYGGFSGNEILPSPLFRDFSNPANRTVIKGDSSEYTIYIEASLRGKSRIDGVTISNEQIGAAIKYISYGDIIISKCRFENNLGGNHYMLYMESLNGEMSIINSVIADNDVVAIYSGSDGCKFINSTIANNENYYLMKITNGNGDNEIRNSIVYNTLTRLYNRIQYGVSVSNSIVTDFQYLTDDGNNCSGLIIPFTGDYDDPYSCPAWIYTTAKGDPNHLTPYLQSGDTDLKDIVGADRFNLTANTIDIGAYQGPQEISSPQYMPELKIEDSYSIDFPTEVSVYPTDIRSGETIYFEKNMDNSLTARIYNTGGVEVYSASLSSSVEEVSVSCPAGIYIITITDDSTGQRLSQEKIIVH